MVWYDYNYQMALEIEKSQYPVIRFQTEIVTFWEEAVAETILNALNILNYQLVKKTIHANIKAFSIGEIRANNGTAYSR